MLNSRSSTKVGIGFGVIILSILLFSAIWIQVLLKSTETVSQITEVHEVSRLASVMTEQSIERMRLLYSLISEADPFQREEQTIEFREIASEFLQARDQYLESKISERERRTWEETRFLLNRIGERQNRILDLVYAEQMAQARLLMDREVAPLQEKLNDNLDKLRHMAGDQVAIKFSEMEAKNANLVVVLSILAAILVCFVVVVAVVVARRAGHDEAMIVNQNERLQSLYKVTSLPGLDHLQQITEMLKLGVNLLGMEFGMVNRIDTHTGEVTVLAAVSPEDHSVEPGETMPINRTYCAFDLDEENTLALENVGNSVYREHPAYRVVGFEAFISFRINVAGSDLVTVNFSHRLPRESRFTNNEKHLVRLIGNWIAVMQEKMHTAEDLLEAKNAAERASQAKSLFLANMSHEIRTPLTSIIGYCHLLKDDSLTSDERKQNIDVVTRSGEHLQQVLNNILDLTKIEAGELNLESIPINTINLLEDMQALVATRAQAKGLDFEVEFNFPLPLEFYSDALRIRQTIFNLVDNAIKFTEFGSIKLGIRYRKELRELHISVSDTGKGMDQNQIKQVFHAFTQADESTTREFGGTGLGLHLSQQLARMMGGDIICTSEPGTGSVLTFMIKLQPQPALQLIYRRTEAAVEKAELRSDRFAGSLDGKVLLAEDNKVNQVFIKSFLNKLGIEVSCAANGEEALNLMDTAEFDLILMDLQMPVMDGVTATRRLRKQGVTIPVVAITANALEEDKEYCLDHGFNDYITKPFNLDAFTELLGDYVSSKVTGPHETVHGEYVK